MIILNLKKNTNTFTDLFTYSLHVVMPRNSRIDNKNK